MVFMEVGVGHGRGHRWTDWKPAVPLEACIGLAVPAGRSVPLAEDRSAAGVHDPTGPEPWCWSVLGPQPRGDHGQQRAGAVTRRSLKSQVAWPIGP
jgi:hypothetical protein